MTQLDDAALPVAEAPGVVSDRRVATILVATALCLTSAQFLSRDTRWLQRVLRLVGGDSVAGRVHDATTGEHARFWDLVHWSAAQSLSYTVAPLILIALVWRRSPREFGLGRPTLASARPYLGLYALATPFVLVASNTAAFQSRYPFYELGASERLWPYLWLWWGLYAIQFVALEFFFRGFLLHGLAPRFGNLAIAVMIVPYNMIHYGKPMAEALAAIVGGAVMGALALRNRSIWWGAALHIGVAATMDIASLAHQGRIL